MNKLTFAFVALLALLPLRADNWLQNGDFANGADHWRGDGRSPADITAAATDPFAKPDPLLSKGLIIPLKAHSWTKISQNFRTKSADLELTINYVFSPGLTLSDREDDYVNVPKQIDNLIFLSFNLPVRQCMVLFSDLSNGVKGIHYDFTPKFGTTEVQTLHAEVNGLTQLEDEVITISFPPGTGNVILQSVALEGSP